MGIYDRDYYQEDSFRPMRPWDNRSMVTLIIIANVIPFVANFVFTPTDNSLTKLLSVTPGTLTQPIEWWKLITYGFAHHDIFHILFNMASLYFLGRSVEDRIGKWEFFRFYMLTLAVCGVVWCFLHSGQGTGLLGASGATTAVVMLFIFYYPNATLLLMMAFPVKAWVLGVIIILSNVFTPRMDLESGRPMVAYDVHLVGAAVAAAYFYMGWNFSAAGAFLTNLKTKARVKKSGLRVHRDSDAEPQSVSHDEKESDRILDKIHREGQDSLTAKERKFMERYSRQVRSRRNQ